MNSNSTIALMTVWSALVLLMTLFPVHGHEAGYGTSCNEDQQTNHTIHCDPSQHVICDTKNICDCKKGYQVDKENKCVKIRRVVSSSTTLFLPSTPLLIFLGVVSFKIYF